MNRKVIPTAIILMMTLSMSGCLADIHLNEGWTEAKVEKKIVDPGKEKSYYVLKTDKGLFEVEKPALDIINNSRNPDIVIGNIDEGKTYRLHHYGYRLDWGFGNFGYWYPYVVDANAIAQNITETRHTNETVNSTDTVYSSNISSNISCDEEGCYFIRNPGIV